MSKASHSSLTEGKPYRVGRSSAGLGLFATKTIKKGTRIIEYTGKRLTNAEAEEVYTKYLFEVNDKWTVDGSPRSNIARYVNHSCKPNAETRIIRSRIYIYAKRKIEPGEEIAYNYGKEYFDSFIKPIGCKCIKCDKKKAKSTARKAAA